MTQKTRWLMLGVVLIAALVPFSQVFADQEFTEMVRDGDNVSSARIEPGKADGQSGISVVFKGDKELHYYATADSAPAPEYRLKITPTAEGVTFGEPVYPEHHTFNDPFSGEVAVFEGDFMIFVPITEVTAAGKMALTVTISGMACTSEQCFPPFTKTLTAGLDVSKWPEVSIAAADAAPAPVEPVETPVVDSTPEPAASADAVPLADVLSGWTTADSSQAKEDGSVAWYFLMALLAGLSINIMPCVLPVIPLIIMRLVSQAKESGPRRVALGFSFCGGIVLFFAMFATVSVGVKLATGTSLDLNSLYRNATAVTVLFLAIVFFALVLMDLLILTLPSSVANKQSGGSGFAASIGMGFFAGVLSTPCSGAVLGAVLVWAQTQTLFVSSLSLILLGVGMALPYAFLVSIPSLLSFVPKPGTWMENFKKAGGFLLLLIAVKFTLTALPKDHLINVLLYGVIFSFAVWMWGSWVTFATPKGRKWTIRLIALVVAVAGGIFLLPAIEEPKIDWQKYDSTFVSQSAQSNQPLVLKFTADWCTNCKIVDKKVFQLPETAKLLTDKGIVAIKADTTQNHFPAAKDLNAVFGEKGSVPLTVVINPAGKTIIKLRGIFTPEEFKKVINEQF